MMSLFKYMFTDLTQILILYLKSPKNNKKKNITKKKQRLTMHRLVKMY